MPVIAAHRCVIMHLTGGAPSVQTAQGKRCADSRLLQNQECWLSRHWLSISNPANAKSECFEGIRLLLPTSDFRPFQILDFRIRDAQLCLFQDLTLPLSIPESIRLLVLGIDNKHWWAFPSVATIFNSWSNTIWEERSSLLFLVYPWVFLQ